MKEKIHPTYEDCTITCTCGNVINTRSTVKEINIAICGACHPFYTGRQKYVDTAGRIEKFQKRFGVSDGGTETVVKKTKRRSKKQIQAAAIQEEKKAKAARKAAKKAQTQGGDEGAEKKEKKGGKKETDAPAADAKDTSAES